MRFTFGHDQVAFSLNDALIVVMLVLWPGSWIVLAVAVGVVLAHPRMARLKMVFNVAQYAFGLSVAVAIASSLHGGVIAAGVGMIGFWLVNALEISTAVSVSSGRPFLRSVWESSRLAMVQMAGNLSVGLLAAWLIEHAPIGLVALIVPLVLLWWSYRQQGERAAEARLFAELARGREEVTATSVETSAQAILMAAARLFSAVEVELLLRHPAGSIRYVGSDSGISLREPAEASGFAAPWVLRALQSRTVVTGVDGGRPYCSAVLGDPDQPLAVLIARRAHAAPGFERFDGRLAQVLVGQAEAWLSAADFTARHDAASSEAAAYGDATRAFGDLGARTAPSLVILRESADRLSRLANAFAGPAPVHDIVDELHAVERAVAALLGVITLSRDPDGRHSDPAAAGDRVSVGLLGPSGRPDTDWTTTGTLQPADLL